MNQDTLYWLFSTIAQTYGAIVGIVGLLVVYRLQNERSIRTELRDRNVNRMGNVFGDKAHVWSPKKMSCHFHDANETQLVRLDGLGTEIKGNLEYDLNRMDQSREYGQKIRRDFEWFLLYHLMLIMFSIIAIYFVPIEYVFHTDTFISVVWLIVLVLLLVISFSLTWPFILSLLKGLEEEVEEDEEELEDEEE